MSLQRTLRVPADGQFPLPPGLGTLPLVRLKRPPVRLPAPWRTAPQFAVPLHQQEALWIGFSGADWKPNALKVAAGGVNALTGSVWQHGLHSTPQDYIVVPNQPWLDGFNVGDDCVRQFVAASLGEGATAEEQLTRGVPVGGLEIELYEPKPGRFPSRPPRLQRAAGGIEAAKMAAMGLGPGGLIQQKVYVDPYGFAVWDRRRSTNVVIHLFNVEEYRVHTGRQAPPSPISAETYAEHGLPWFDLFDEQTPSVPGAPVLAGLDSQAHRTKRPLDPATLPVVRLSRRPHSRPGSRKDRSHG